MTACDWAACPLPGTTTVGRWTACTIHAVEPYAATSPTVDPNTRHRGDAVLCGTRAGARSHRRRGEPTCGACQVADRVRPARRRGATP